MNKILLVLTGGTICSSKNENGLNALNTEAAVPTLVEMYEEKLRKEVATFDTIAPINTLSENMTIDKWNQLIAALKQVDFDDYIGVMILHGTDTLHLTSALMGVLLQNVGCPVMMVSAHRILDDPESNGVDNFTKSVMFIERIYSEVHKYNGEAVIKTDTRAGGVYMIYRNTSGISYVHHATHLEECGDYSEDFYSSDMIEYDELMRDWDGDWFHGITDVKEKSDIGKARDSMGDKAAGKFSLQSAGSLRDNILYIKPYVGINYDRISLENVKAVLHGMYHSSTINTDGDGPTSAMSLLRKCNELGIDFYIFPCKDGDYRYSTTRPLIEEGAECIYGGTWEEAYVRLLLAYSADEYGN